MVASLRSARLVGRAELRGALWAVAQGPGGALIWRSDCYVLRYGGSVVAFRLVLGTCPVDDLSGGSLGCTDEHWVFPSGVLVVF